MSLSKIINLAKEQLSTTESPSGSNKTKYGEWYGVNGVPWCVIFLCWLFNHADEKDSFYGGNKVASCTMLYQWYKEKGLTISTDNIQVGDIIFENFNGKKTTDHCGIVIEKGPLSGTWYVIEGNTSPGEEGSQDNGGCVALKIRHTKNIVAVCRPQYKPDIVVPNDCKTHWALDSIKWCLENELVNGYKDGSFKPNKTITRAEVCTILYRFYKFLKEE